jgi:hypothetical protein
LVPPVHVQQVSCHYTDKKGTWYPESKVPMDPADEEDCMSNG